MSTVLDHLPDDTPCYVPGVGEVTLGAVRGTGTEEGPGLDEQQATVDMYCDLATRNLDRPPWDTGASLSAIRAFHEDHAGPIGGE